MLNYSIIIHLSNNINITSKYILKYTQETLKNTSSSIIIINLENSSVA